MKQPPHNAKPWASMSYARGDTPEQSEKSRRVWLLAKLRALWEKCTERRLTAALVAEWTAGTGLGRAALMDWADKDGKGADNADAAEWFIRSLEAGAIDYEEPQEQASPEPPKQAPRPVIVQSKHVGWPQAPVEIPPQRKATERGKPRKPVDGARIKLILARYAAIVKRVGFVKAFAALAGIDHNISALLGKGTEFPDHMNRYDRIEEALDCAERGELGPQPNGKAEPEPVSWTKTAQHIRLKAIAEMERTRDQLRARADEIELAIKSLREL